MRRSRKPVSSLCGSVGFLILLLWTAIPLFHAHAAEPIAFDLPEQTLNTALSGFSERTGYSILVDETVTQGRRANAVRGDFTPRQALEKLLAGTGLTVRYSTERAFTLALQTREETARREDARHETRTSYETLLQSELTAYLCKVQPERFGRYRVLFRLWLNEEGSVERMEFVESAEALRHDADLPALLARFSVGVPPPADMPQPLTILLTPRHDPLMDCRRQEERSRS